MKGKAAIKSHIITNTFKVVLKAGDLFSDAAAIVKLSIEIHAKSG